MKALEGDSAFTGLTGEALLLALVEGRSAPTPPSPPTPPPPLNRVLPPSQTVVKDTGTGDVPSGAAAAQAEALHVERPSELTAEGAFRREKLLSESSSLRSSKSSRQRRSSLVGGDMQGGAGERCPPELENSHPPKPGSNAPRAEATRTYLDDRVGLLQLNFIESFVLPQVKQVRVLAQVLQRSLSIKPN
jgi:hypothetical protein